MRWKSVKILLGTFAIAVMMAVAGLSPASAAADPACPQQISSVVSYGLTYRIETGNFGRLPECLTFYGNRTAFRIASSFTAPAGGVKAYSSVGLGCSYYGRCTVGSPLPIRISALKYPRASFSYAVNKAPGRWNASIEMWTNRQRSIASHPNGAEIMIWLDRHSIYKSTRGLKIMRINGTSWYLQKWHAGKGSPVEWDYVHFLRVHPVTHVTNLRLAPFYRAAEQLGLLKKGWYLESMQGGFEIYSQGQGLAVTRFRARP